MDVNAWKLLRNFLEELDVISDWQIGIDAALHHDLRCSLLRSPFDAPKHLVVRHRVAFGVTFRSEERAKRTVHVADVRIIDRRVDDVADLASRIDLRPSLVRGGAKVVQRGLPIQRETLVIRETLTMRRPL